MPNAICKKCTRLSTYGGLCDRCRLVPVAPVIRDRSKDKKRGRRKNPYSLSGDKQWMKLSREYLEQHPICVRHKNKLNKIVAAKHVDHVFPVSMRPDLKYETSNLASLCPSCHSLKTSAEQRGLIYDWR